MPSSASHPSPSRFHANSEPVGVRSGAASRMSSLSGAIALAAIRSKRTSPPCAISSARAWATRSRGARPLAAVTASRKRAFFPIDSMSISDISAWRERSRAASGTPGNPPPEPRSAILPRPPGSRRSMCGVATRASRRCRVARSSGSLTRVRLIAGFHASSRRRCAVKIAVSAAESSGSDAAVSWRASSARVSRSVGGSTLGSMGSGARSGGVVSGLSPQLRSLALRCVPVDPWSGARRRAPLRSTSRHHPSPPHLSCSREYGLQG